jgi:hypothetical protein
MTHRTLALIVALLCARPAHAGRTFYGWLYGTEVMPEGRVELQSWVFEENGKVGNTKQTSLWWGPLVGITDQLELALPVEAGTASADGVPATFSLQRFGAELRYRLVTADPAQAPALVPLVRVAIKRDVITRDDLHLEADLVASYEAGDVHALADAGFTADLTPGNRHVEVHPGAGISVRVVDELRLGAEAYAELSFDGQSWAIAGPDLSWTHSRFWISAALGLGLYQVRVAPRVVWGIAF